MEAISPLMSDPKYERIYRGKTKPQIIVTICLTKAEIVLYTNSLFRNVIPLSNCKMSIDSQFVLLLLAFHTRPMLPQGESKKNEHKTAPYHIQTQNPL